MKLFQTEGGFIFSFGFDMRTRKPDPHVVCWNDPGTGEWEVKVDNCAGDRYFIFPVAPEFVFEVDGKLVAYQPGRCIEFTYIGGSFVWACALLAPDTSLEMAA